MALTSSVVTRHEIPHEPGEWMRLRMLSWRELDLARQERVLAIARYHRSVGLDYLRDLQASAREPSADDNGRAAASPTADDLLASYDRGTLLRAGIVEWSYDPPVSPETIDALDEQTALWAARLLVPAPPPEAERLKG
jgi:hypothetical protein